MKITPQKAIEILNFNLKEAGLNMPMDCRTSVELSVDNLTALQAERRHFGVTRIAQLPHEELEK